MHPITQLANEIVTFSDRKHRAQTDEDRARWGEEIDRAIRAIESQVTEMSVSQTRGFWSKARTVLGLAAVVWCAVFSISTAFVVIYFFSQVEPLGSYWCRAFDLVLSLSGCP